jgi:hypothetical protein
MKTATNKRLLISKSRGDLNWCTPTGETWHTWHIRFSCQSTYATHTFPAGHPRMCQPFMLTQQSWIDSLLLRKIAPESTSQPDWVGSRTHLSFSPKHNYWSSALKPNIYWRIGYIGLLGPYHQHVISTFNTCSRGPTHRSLTDTGRGYNHGGTGLPHHTPRPSQPTVLHFHLRAPSGLRLTIQQIPIELEMSKP